MKEAIKRADDKKVTMTTKGTAKGTVTSYGEEVIRKEMENCISDECELKECQEISMTKTDVFNRGMRRNSDIIEDVYVEDEIETSTPIWIYNQFNGNLDEVVAHRSAMLAKGAIERGTYRVVKGFDVWDYNITE